jgi:hypothetical protein
VRPFCYVTDLGKQARLDEHRTLQLLRREGIAGSILGLSGPGHREEADNLLPRGFARRIISETTGPPQRPPSPGPDVRRHGRAQQRPPTVTADSRSNRTGTTLRVSPIWLAGDARPLVSAELRTARKSLVEHAGQRTSMLAGNALNSAPMRAAFVKRAYEPGPVTTCCRRAWPDCSSGSSSQLRGLPAVLEESSWSARSRVAARANELDAGKRWEIIEGAEGPVLRFGL